MASARVHKVGNATTNPGHRETMRAIVRERYGPADTLELREVDRPVVRDDEVLIRVQAASVNPYEWHYMRGEPYIARAHLGLSAPRRKYVGVSTASDAACFVLVLEAPHRVRLRPASLPSTPLTRRNPRTYLRRRALSPKSTSLGVDVAGTVEEVGGAVAEFKLGDEVFGWSDGSLAEYAIGRESTLVAKPANVTAVQAGSVGIAAFTAIQSLRDWGKVEAGQKVLINGAAGGVGTFAVQLAKVFGAEVTGVCSTRNIEMVRSIGADRVIDYTRDDFTRGGQSYDLMLEMIGNHSVSKCLRVIAPKGTFVMLGGRSGRWIRPVERALMTKVLSPFVSQSMVVRTAVWSKEDLAIISDLMEAGRVTPVIDRTYPLSRVPDAIRYLEEGHARGKVVISLAGTGQVSDSGSA